MLECCATGAARAARGWPNAGQTSIKRRLRLRRRSDFQQTISGKRFHSGRALVGFAVPSSAPEGRIGVTVSRGIKTSVERNRARRRLREVARSGLLGPDSPLRQVGIRYDVVLIARPAALEVSFADLRAEASLAALRLANLTP
ncbi:MAG: ribonuclease P protein component [Chloroflexi bacterium]|nr:MAG: ribonuclease P protein component [Chloroflexota bacterium]TMF38118.1 MAG: ribonuclease P protein component [Chloroflexota bacterium]